MEDIMLIGLDIPKFVKALSDQFCHMGITPDMTEREELAYKSGVNATLSLLDQALNGALEDADDSLIVHVPGVMDAEEFFTIEEIMERKYEG